MTNFTEKILSVINKNFLINLAPKLTLYHFHRLSKKLKTKVDFLYSFGQILLLILFYFYQKIRKKIAQPFAR